MDISGNIEVICKFGSLPLWDAGSCLFILGPLFAKFFLSPGFQGLIFYYFTLKSFPCYIHMRTQEIAFSTISLILLF